MSRSPLYPSQGPRQSLYQQLPEVYRIKDGEQRPANQLKAYMNVLDEVMAGMHGNIEALYHDFFIETCDDWLIPYMADQLALYFIVVAKAQWGRLNHSAIPSRAGLLMLWNSASAWLGINISIINAPMPVVSRH
jgi:hypothetical protein